MNSSEADPGRVLVNRYRLDDVIGTGGMGRVWRGTDTLLDRPVAIKELTTPPGLPDHEVEVLRTRMIREARSAAQLSHPAIITVFDVADEDGRPWIVMELVEGPSLGTLLQDEGTLSVLRAAEIGEQMAAGLAEAHRRGIVHRDIKPGNVLIAGDHRAVLTDFGIAHLDGSTHLTSTGLLIGSPSYLAPEVAHGRSATAASDVWALGVTLYQAVEGTLPFERPTPMSTLTAIVTQDLPEPTRAGALAPLLADLCAKEPGDRPSVDRVRARLREIRESAGSASTTATAVAPAPVPAPEPTPAAQEPAPAAPAAQHAAAPAGGGGRRSNRTRNLVIAAVAFVVLAAGATTSALVSMNRDDNSQLVGDSEQAGVAEEASEEPSEPQEEPEDEASEPDEASDGDDGGREDEDDDSDDEEWDFLERHEDESGFSVDVPEDWDIERDGHMVRFENPDGGYLMVDQTDDPNDDAGDDWRDLEPAASGNFPGYSLIGIEDVDADWTDDYDSAADWEFTFSGDSGDRHAINRGFHTSEKGYALFLVSPEDPEVNHRLLDRISESFEPA
ncbi:serine/threonine protein kinase [Nocardiopsis sp. HNM0947]|uniref:non-specific serine/threonine protein kinase n=1 Tax=Nocardiopsis coralli TaxID=2772213 RepID=A0ABR9P2G4_9ACTN|nr:serine/threonine-protein kinase [Nocardiopsis coralli]MBE2998019.1 serine/threonine protein kinase [Nocardiopsis coralli]